MVTAQPGRSRSALHGCSLPMLWGGCGFGDITFGEDISYYQPALDERLAALLKRWVNQFSRDDFSVVVSKKGLSGAAVRYGDAAAHIESLQERLATVLAELASL